MPLNLIVNGQPRQVEPGASIHTLLAQASLTPDKVAIELNRRLIRSDRYDTPLQEGDQVEIVTFVGGG